MRQPPSEPCSPLTALQTWPSSFGPATFIMIYDDCHDHDYDHGDDEDENDQDDYMQIHGESYYDDDRSGALYEPPCNSFSKVGVNDG